MFENMSAFVGYAMHDDLLGRARKNARLVEAERMRKEQRQAAPRESYRAGVARALVAIAARLAPTITLPKPDAATATHAR